MGPRFTVIEFTLIVLAPHICPVNNYVNNEKLHYVIDAVPRGAITVQLTINPITLNNQFQNSDSDLPHDSNSPTKSTATTAVFGLVLHCLWTIQSSQSIGFFADYLRFYISFLERIGSDAFLFERYS